MKHGVARVLATVLLAGITCVQAEAASWCVAVWYPSSAHPGGAETILRNQERIDIVHPFWYSPLPDGALQAHAGAEDPRRLAAWREAGLMILPSIFSGTWSFLGPETRPRHVREIADLVERHDYDGIDIDYEGFAAHTRELFSAFIEELAEALHARGRLLSVTVHAKTGDEGAGEGARAQDWARLADAADLFNLMTYDYTSRNEPPGPIAPTSWMLEVLDYAASVTDSASDFAKVRVGLPFYGYSWLRDRPPATAVTWEASQRMVSSFGLEVAREPDSMEGRLELDVRGLPKQTLYFNDAASTAHKLSRVLGAYPQLAGVAIWGLGGEDPDTWGALERARSAPCRLAER